MDQELNIHVRFDNPWHVKATSQHSSGFLQAVEEPAVMHLDDNQIRIFDRWCDINDQKPFDRFESVLVPLYKFLQETPKDVFKNLSGGSCYFEFDICKFDKDPKQGLWEEELASKYKGWYYIVFDYDFSSILNLPKYREWFPQQQFEIAWDKEWPELYVFTKEITAENLTTIFDRLTKLHALAVKVQTAKQEAANKVAEEIGYLW